jgi:tRNA (adenine-N(1)-)-methyltransferase non-catalytic subunit
MINLGKFGRVKCDALIGKLSGLTYEIVDENTVSKIDLQEDDFNNETEDIEQQATNESIVDSQTSQTLSHEEIEQMKQDGLEGKLKGDVSDRIVPDTLFN